MPSYNSRLQYPIPFHRRTEADRKGVKTFLRGKEGRSLRRSVKTRVHQRQSLPHPGESEVEFRRRRNKLDAARAAKIRANAKGTK